MKRDGFSFIDLILTLGITVLLFGGIYLVYFTILDVVNNSSLRTLAVSVLNKQVETIRNLPYDSVGIVGGLPPGTIPAQQSSTVSGFTFLINATVRNIDDPFDGTLGGTPNDTSPADYKIIELEVTCVSCSKNIPIYLTTTVAPKGLESASSKGSLFIKVFDANGLPLSGADVRVVNASVTPAIDLEDSTNASGTLQLVDVSTSTQSYSIEVTKSGHSSEKTYPIGGAGNPNPIKPHATVAERTATQVSFAIDRVSAISVRTSDEVCAPIGSKNFSAKGTKLIGTSPDVFKYSTSSITGASGLKTLTGIEWDTYSFTLNEASYDLLGTIPLYPLLINPNSSVDFRFVIKPSEPNSLLVTIKNAATGAPIPNALINLSAAGFSKTLTTGRGFLKHTDWSSNAYASQDGGVETESTPGKLKLISSGGAYSTTTTSWLISNTLDVGSTTSAFYALSWNPVSQPAPTGMNSAKFQIASNNDSATWNFVGPDGTPNTYYASSGAATYSGHANDRYMRYKVFLKTDDENYTPEIDDASIEFYSACVPLSQALFTNLAAGDYLIDVAASGYVQATSSVSVTGSWHQAELLLNSQ